MGKQTRRKQEAAAARQPNFSVILKKATSEEREKMFQAENYNPLKLIRGYERYAVKPLKGFMPRTRSLNTSTRGKELIRYAFNKYKPPAFLYDAWEMDTKSKYRYLFGLPEDFKLWYIALAQGKSLYKECSMGLLTKKETHFFSTCIYPLTIPQSVWYAVIRGLDDGITAAQARKIAMTKISDHKIDDFWKGVARWFLENDTSVRQMNDLLDYINARHQEHPQWYVKDRTMDSLVKAMISWHRELHRMNTMSSQYVRWDGIDISDIEYIADVKSNNTINKIWYQFHQITTGKELAEEGNKQHHCVSSYAHQCSEGQCSIWSMKQRDEFSSYQRALTIEVRRDGTIAQARGYANRSARPDEMRMLKQWAAKYGFRVNVGVW